jgi:hypothetical protein
MKCQIQIKKVNGDNNLNTEGVVGQFHKCHCYDLVYSIRIKIIVFVDFFRTSVHLSD